MSVAPISVSELTQLAPYGILVLGAILLLCFSRKREHEPKKWILEMSAGAIVLATMGALWILVADNPGKLGFFVHDALGFQFAQILLFFLLLTIPLAAHRGSECGNQAHVSLSLLLLSACGGLIMVYANHVLLFAMGIEILSIPLYVMTGMGPNQKSSREASMKYLLLGAIAFAFFMYGLALAWGSSGTAYVHEMVSMFGKVSSFGFSRCLILGLGFMFVGIAFKLGLAPFHMWLPDVYEGGPSMLVAWMSGAIKAAVFVFLVRLFGNILHSQDFSWVSVVRWISIISMVWGSVGALVQTNIKRILAYSAISHAGYATIALICYGDGSLGDSIASLSFYVLAYGLATFVSFAVVSLEEKEGYVATKDFAGLGIRRPFLAFALSVSLLSLAGFPPLAGFVAKFIVFSLAVERGHLDLVFVAVITSLISLSMYIKVIAAVYIEKPSAKGSIALTWDVATVIFAGTILVMLLGLVPGSWLDHFAKMGAR